MENKNKRPRDHQKTGERVNEVLKENGISQRELKRRLLGLPAGSEVNSSDISDICKGYDPVTEKMADRIIKLFPDRHYEKAWLMGLSDYKTAGAAFHARWNDLTQPDRDRKAAHAAIASMMALCGLSWDGDSIAHLQRDKDGKTVYQGETYGPVPGSEKIVSYDGVDFETWELAAIADETFQFLQMRLDYAARTKKQKNMNVFDRQQVCLHLGRKSR